MKQLLTLFVCILLVTTVTHAQNENDSSKYSKEKMKGKNMDSTRKQELKGKGLSKKNLEALDLTKDQEKQINEIHSNARKEKEKINNDNSLTEEQKQEKIKALDKETKSKTNAVLTPEQRQKLKQNKANTKRTK